MSLSSTSRFGGSISLSLTQSAYFHPPSTSRLFRAPSTDKEDMESSMRSLQPFQQSVRRSPRIGAMGEKLPSERSVFGEGVGAGEEGEQGAVTLVCGDVEECATWRSLLTRSIRLATLGATHRTGTGTGTGTRRVRTHRSAEEEVWWACVWEWWEGAGLFNSVSWAGGVRKRRVED